MKMADIIVVALMSMFLFSFYTYAIVYANSRTHFTIINSNGERFQLAFTSIQQAINEAENGSTIIVPSGLFREHVIVNKTVSLIGENVSTVVIDGEDDGTVIHVVADNVNISDLTIVNSGCKWDFSGVCIYRSKNCIVKDCYFSNSCHNINVNHSSNCKVFGNWINGKCYGIRLMNSVNCAALDNYVSNCYGGIILANASGCVVRENTIVKHGYGLRFDSPCKDNLAIDNNVSNNGYDGLIAIMPGSSSFINNSIYHNNFINNTYSFIVQTSYGFKWDGGYPSGGNYWSRYNGTDVYSGPNQDKNGSDGIGDKAYNVTTSHRDFYPLINPWSALSIHNINTGLGYKTIQEAVEASETLNGHTIYVEHGIYCGNIVINKTLVLLGEDAATTVIDGGCNGTVCNGTVLTVNADNVSVVGFTIRNGEQSHPSHGSGCGLFLNYSNSANISNNIIISNRIGLYLFFSQENSLENNIVANNHGNGLWLWYSGNNVLKGNSMFNNSYNFGVFGGHFSDFNNQIDVSNMVDGKPVLYKTQARDEVLNNTETGVLYLINCNNITVQNLSLARNGHGVFCYNTTNSRIVNVTVFENNYGVYLQKSHDNAIEGNRCFDNWVGVCLHDSTRNIVKNNFIDSNEKGISLYDTTNNSVAGNTVRNNLYGVRVYNSHFNKIFHNNLIDNNEQVSLISPSYQNVWDNGFEGNFWSDYEASDNVQDGIGDAERTIDENNIDHYPLLGIFQNFHISFYGESYNVEVISNSTILEFTFETSNRTIRMIVNGTDGTYGFCRLSIPHALIMPEVIVIIDDNATQVLHENFSIHDDGFCRWIYFAYSHSTHEILIIPEFLVIYLTMLIGTALLCLLKKCIKKKMMLAIKIFFVNVK